MAAEPLIRFVLGVGYMVTIAAVSKSDEYIKGVKDVSCRYPIGGVMYTSGVIIGGIIFGVLILGPLRQLADTLFAEGTGNALFQHPSSMLVVLPSIIICIVFFPFFYQPSSHGKFTESHLSLSSEQTHWFLVGIQIEAFSIDSIACRDLVDGKLSSLLHLQGVRTIARFG